MSRAKCPAFLRLSRKPIDDKIYRPYDDRTHRRRATCQSSRNLSVLS
ncbi:hypothetical protein JT327_gp31 [Aeromonas phage LAh_7]|uniref:Uncharacterized protein n=1 Tax=Aeromonas phage LAh_7 TaxID=2591031 RepID=A0A514A0E3_9CAUD|nr:hypothetical protein JT327_gp31 [Aeromonas phage LAh_7]QDH46716.1 hypothetical protein LAh7_31 [Aeromonas phage LAh_7]